MNVHDYAAGPARRSAASPGQTPDGSDQLDLLCDDGIEEFVAFATDYYGLEDLDRAAVAHVFALRPLTPGRRRRPQSRAHPG